MHGTPEVVLDAEGHFPAPVTPHVGKAEAGRGEPDEEHQPDPQRRGVPDDHPVDDLALHQGNDGLAHAAEDGGHHGQGHIPAMAQHQTRQASHPPR